MLDASQVGGLLLWATLSVGLSLYNKWLLGQLKFDFPIILSFAHMAGSALMLNVYVRLGDGVKAFRTHAHDDFIKGEAAAGRRFWWMRHYSAYLVPVACMFATSVCLRNSAFASLPLPVMQLVASCAPLCSYVLSVLAGVAPFSFSCLTCMFACVVGVIVAIGDRFIPFSGLALARHAIGVFLQVGRGVVLQLLFHRLEQEHRHSTVDADTGVASQHSTSGGGGCKLVWQDAASGALTVSCPKTRSAPLEKQTTATCCAPMSPSKRLLAALPALPSQTASNATSKQQKNTVDSGEILPPCRPFPSSPTRPQKTSPDLPTPRHPDTAEHIPAPRSKCCASVGLPALLLSAYAPLCAALLAIPAAAFELGPFLTDALERPSWFWAVLAGNIAVALTLNLVSLFCLQHVGVLAVSLTGFVKDWVLVAVSTAVFGREVTPRFVAGMLVTTAAVLMYVNLRERRRNACSGLSAATCGNSK